VSDVDFKGPYHLWADMLASRYIGLEHARLVGEIVSADARFNIWALHGGRDGYSGEEWFAVLIAIQDREDEVQEIWDTICAQGTGSLRRRFLPGLAESLRRMLDALENACREKDTADE
jgi:hypothetical protein